MSETILLSHGELDRATVLTDVVAGRLRQVDAARQLGLTSRQVRRLIKRFVAQGPAGLASRRRGQPSNRRLPAEVREAAVALAAGRYAGFNLTHLHEMLVDVHGLVLSRESLRRLLIGARLHRPSRRPARRRHPGRPRRPCRGELVQIDGSDHAWFGPDKPRCCLIVFIDDATGELPVLHFAPVESTRAYLHALRDYLAEHGRPAALYSDRHSIFRNSLPGHEGDLTQFARVLKTLDIEGIHARTPQAKGRVERANQTLQDRLINEMRLAGVEDIAAGNRFLAAYRQRYNARFARAPASPRDAHRPVRHGADALELILSIHSERTVSKDLVVRYDNARYALEVPGRQRRFRGRKVTICETLEGQVLLCSSGKRIDCRLIEQRPAPVALSDEKSIHQHVEDALRQQRRRRGLKPRADHPWNRPILTSAGTG